MQDSGIEFDLISQIEADALLDDDNFYALKSKVIVGSPKVELKHVNMPLRANLRQQLQKAQLAEEVEREKDTSLLSQSHRHVSTKPQVIQVPMSSSLNSGEVPVHILKVQTQLKNPTLFHVQENKKRQIQAFLSKSLDSPGAIQSLPNISTMTINTNELGLSGSAPVDPDSPLSVGLSSCATSVSDMDNLLSDILSLEPVDVTVDHDLNSIEPSLTHMSSTLPQSNLVNNVHELTGNTESSNSCPAAFRRAETPPFMSEEESRMWAKDRQKKDNHNMIERRRRFNINDRIKELGTLLPKTIDPDLRQNKGTILKASVDYIRRLKKDQERNRQLEDRQRGLEQTNRKMLLRIQQLELLMQAQGMTSGMQDDIDNFIMQSNASHQIQQQQNISMTLTNTQNLSPAVTLAPLETHSQTHHLLDDLMDDTSPLGIDPMLSSQPVSPNDMDDSEEL
ncbi:microphthalmia-associated transcription factor-like isoform X2 [Mizuhopecten yessoensis]|uniref:Microphthalmia-associated transcription factor n=1 Tax=Mizuhopecten yessoensis TaxID=6573 RepID=A0A210Q923_MIZYE|nr:microphthalmia-associated transcription factor-like isoform X2 [Mizuhopecten yessoensis]OWF45234.1 Microphthalmia-associated transcription factor [Mizuhopecten yessoensis]